MIPENLPEIIQFSHLQNIGGSDYTQCERCGTWNHCEKYREAYIGFSGGRLFWLCKECGSNVS